jgi:hypothetical protein
MTPPGVIVMHKATFVTSKPCAWRSVRTNCIAMYTIFVTYKRYCQCKRCLVRTYCIIMYSCLVCINWIIQLCRNMTVVETRWQTNESVLFINGYVGTSITKFSFNCNHQHLNWPLLPLLHSWIWASREFIRCVTKSLWMAIVDWTIRCFNVGALARCGSDTLTFR